MEGKWKTAQSSDQTLSWRPLHWSAHGVILLTEAHTSFCSILIYCQKERFWDRGEVCKSWVLSLPSSTRMWMLERGSREGLWTGWLVFKTISRETRSCGKTGHSGLHVSWGFKCNIFMLQVSKYIDWLIDWLPPTLNLTILNSIMRFQIYFLAGFPLWK